MRTKIILFSIVLTLITGCSLFASEEQEEIIDFVNNDIQKIATYEAEAQQALDTVIGENYTNDAKMYEVLTETVIPTYQKAVDEANQLNSDLDVLKNLISKIKEGSNVYLEGVMLLKEGIEKQDPELINQANDKLEKYTQLSTEYQEQVEQIAEEYNLEYEDESIKNETTQ
ncbi:hypothetical protein LC087_09670 [Bacillus carboniphilus]|uniref:Lipoprotein n=1 Tax=Bacillus carboniphilus TaxID=86663 RepID=A0ABY9JP75_9BACI|nr:hypothetical protein [Bacillus carboniphilus]WLR41212.1 hypothetical protein LC087_09670 [Bacillus carboniphilus]